jgi:hypothetical protein
VGLDGQLEAELAGAEDLDLHAGLGDQARGDERGGDDDGAGFEALGEAADVDRRVVLAEVEVLEAALGQAAGHRELSTLEARAHVAGLGLLLALVPATGGLAVSRGAAAAEALLVLAGAPGGDEVVQALDVFLRRGVLGRHGISPCARLFTVW